MNHYQREESERPPVHCPECGELAAETKTRFGIRSDCCGLWSWNRYPLVSREVHLARNAAHNAFDNLWESGLVKRDTAYAMLSDRLGRQAHIKEMTLEELQKVPGWVTEMRAALEERAEADDGSSFWDDYNTYGQP